MKKTKLKYDFCIKIKSEIGGIYVDSLKKLGLEEKYVVLKVEDIESLGQVNRVAFDSAIYSINEKLISKGKKANNYLVINTDEPYADEVLSIIKKHVNI